MKKTFIAVFMGLCACLPARPVLAVVGQAEEYNYFEQKQLDDFHDKLVNQEKYRQLEQSDDFMKELNRKNRELKKLEGVDKDQLDKEIQNLKKQLLELPKRDRFRIEVFGQHLFDTNINRKPFQEEKSDSVFDAKGVVLFDLSGKKTDLRFEIDGGKQWNIAYPEKDSKQMQEVLRYRRKYFTKIQHSAQSRIARTNNKTPEIDSEKIRWDSSQNTAFNYALSRRFSVNNDLSLTHRFFTQEAFDQDSSWEATWAPSVFWAVTPKSRFAGGYRIANNRIRTKTGNAVAHEIHGGYFGRITRKSSANIDLSFSHQSPRSRDTATVNTMTAGVGYLLQITPKTQGLLQYIYSVQNTTENVLDDTAQFDAAATDESVVGKNDSRFYNNSISVGLNTRLNSKLTGVLTVNPYYLVSQMAKSSSDSDNHQWGLPVSISFTYVLRRWAILTTGYTYSVRLGDEHTNRNRAHMWRNSLRLIF